MMTTTTTTMMTTTTTTTTTTTPSYPPFCHRQAYKNDGRCPSVSKNPEGTGGGEDSDGVGAAEGGGVVVKPILCVLVLKRSSACVQKIIADIFFYVTDIPNSTCTITGSNLIKGVLKNIY
jgi:hypothetical protein